MAFQLSERECGLLPIQRFKKENHFHRGHAERLRVELTLEGHEGCVNRVSWSDEGTWLVSGSDDRKLIIWNHVWNPTSDESSARLRPIAKINTPHRSNIFGAKFLPCTGNTKLVSCAMDHAVILHEIAQTSSGEAYASSSAGSTPTLSTPFFCHTNRVKDVEVEPGNPYNFWSAGEDGTVREYDVRSKEGRGPSSQSAATVLLSVGSDGSPVEIKSLAINPRRSHLIAVGCGDPFLRIYDRRMLSKCPPPSARAGDYNRGKPVMSLAPAHMTGGGGVGSRSQYSTYVHWSRSGDRILSNYHSDNIYLFDTSSSGCISTSLSMPAPSHHPPGSQQEPPEASHGFTFAPSPLSLGLSSQGYVRWTGGKSIDEVIRLGEEAIQDQDWPSAVKWMEMAAKARPSNPSLHSKLAKSLIARGWFGDGLAALIACEWALLLDQGNKDCLLIRIKALRSLGQLECARQGLSLRLGQIDTGVEEEEELRSLKEELDRELMQRHKRRGLWLRQREQKKREKGELQRTMSEGRSTPRPGNSLPSSPPATTSMGIASSSRIVAMAREATLAREAAENQQDQQEGTMDADGGGEEEEEEDHASHMHEIESDEGEEEDDPGKEKLLDFYQRLFASSHEERKSVRYQAALLDTLTGAVTHRMIGRVNEQTDIKEATFLGRGDKLIGAGSDDGRLYVFCSETGHCIRASAADGNILNCVQSHPELPILATSGIESCVKIWSAAPESCAEEPESLQEILNENMTASHVGGGGGLGLTAARLRQALVDSPHLYNLLMSRLTSGGMEEGGGQEDEGERRHNLECRVN